MTEGPPLKTRTRLARSVRVRLRRAVRRVRSRRPADASPSASLRWTAPIELSVGSSSQGPTIVLLNDCRDQINFGANALVDGLIDIVAGSVPGATLLPIPSHWLIEREFFASFVDGGAGLRQPQALFPRLADQFEAVADEWMAGNGGRGAREYLDRFERADLVLLNGEASLYAMNQSAFRELFVAWLCKVRLGIPTVFVNGTVHLTDVMPFLPAMVRKTFKTLDAVAVREPPSLRNLREYAPEVEARMVPDTGFVFTPDDARLSPAVLAIREQLGGDRFFSFDPGAMPMDDGALYDLISALQRVTPRAVFVATGPSDGYIERIARETNSVFVDSIVDYREWMAFVAEAEFLVTGRHHNVILAAIMGCPSVAFGSTNHKVHGACELLDGLVGSPYDGTDIRSHLGQIDQQARACVKDREVLRERLQVVCARRRTEAFELGPLVADAVRIGARGARAARP